MKTVFVTGASGFVGAQLITKLASIDNFFIYGTVHRKKLAVSQPVTEIEIQSLNDAGLFLKLGSIDTVIHLAAKTSRGGDGSFAEKERMKDINIDGTLNLARQAADHGVKRFVFLSTVKVNGETTQIGQPFTEADPAEPEDCYGRFKWEAEKGLINISKKTGMELVIIRPPLVYGPGVKGNFVGLMGLVVVGLPLPFGAIDNKRSLISIDNLVDFIITCIEHPAAANQTFLISDGTDFSTSELLLRIAKAMGKPLRMWPVSRGLLEVTANLFGQKNISRRLFDSLQVDASKARDLLDWQPAVSVDESLARCVQKEPRKKTERDWCLIRFFDFILSAVGLVVCLPIFAVIIILGWLDTGSPFFFQERVGRYRKPFVLVKFRTMKLDTTSIASHLVSSSFVTKLGRILRKTKLDELLQLWNVIKGEMSLVGPRPCLFNQGKLIKEREMRSVLDVRPGITGLAQVNGIDMSTPKLLAETDAEMIRQLSVKKYLAFILQTITGKGSGDRVKN